MLSERLRRVVDGLLNAAERAAAERQWDEVVELAQQVLQLDDAPAEAVDDARAFLQIAAGASREARTAPPRTASRPQQVGSGVVSTLQRAQSGGASFTTLGDGSTLVTMSPRMFRLFYSYASADEDELDKLVAHLAGLTRTNQWELDEWHRGKAELGRPQSEQMLDHLNRADIIILLITPDYVREQIGDPTAELGRVLERARASDARVVPVRMKPVELSDDDPLCEFEWLPDRESAVSTAENEDAALAAVAAGIKKLCKALAFRESDAANIGPKRAG